MAEQRFRISNLSQIILYKIYAFHIAGDENKPLTLREIRSLFELPLSLNLIEASIEWMRRKISADYLRRIGTRESYRFSIGPEGIKFVEMELLRKQSPISYFQQHGEESLAYVAGLESPFMTEEERRSLDDDWRPIELDREGQAYIEAEQALEEAIKAIEQDNEFAANMPEERAGIIQTIKNGAEWLKAQAPTKRQIRDMLISPLNWVASNFSRTVMAEIAKKAAEKLWALLNTF
ncbi:hypothetical protein JQ599_14370 [Bradyrhizobium diazoefficiens]|nr:hypothetical protein [Bradyrhizobium diazoefficiens]MBR0701089.1 hypothetical protein [Bradyrhizobium diazoefficiens]MBR0769514.1 hypothetical protein [Bradyrhizobium diazoefficiens]